MEPIPELVEDPLSSLSFRQKFYPSVSDHEWNNWRWQLSNSLKSFSDLAKIANLSDNECKALNVTDNPFPVSITPYYSQLIHPTDPNHPIRRMVIPVTEELYWNQGEEEDPLGEDHSSPVPCIIHRYPDRVLFLVSSCCASYCRYCTRSRLVGQQSKISSDWSSAIDYIKSHYEIRDVLLSGGDPLMLSDQQLLNLLDQIRSIPHVEFIRIGSKIPVVLPQRITSELCSLLKSFHPLWMSLHFTHPEEITPEVKLACIMLSDAGIPLGSQTVLLRGINDNVLVLKKLYHELLKIRVRPYYLYQCDATSGTSHFRTPVSTGIDMIQGLRGHTSGYAVPQFVIDAPNGGGKIPLLPEYYQGKDKDRYIILKNYQNKIFRYPDFV